MPSYPIGAYIKWILSLLGHEYIQASPIAQVLVILVGNLDSRFLCPLKTYNIKSCNKTIVSIVNRIPCARVGDGAQVAAAGDGARREESPVRPRRLLQELRALQLGHLATKRRGPRVPRQRIRQGRGRNEETHHQCQTWVQGKVIPKTFGKLDPKIDNVHLVVLRFFAIQISMK